MPKRRAQNGFTLIELMVVIVILGGLIAIVGTNVIGNLKAANIGTAETQMKNIYDAAKLYYLRNRKPPNDLSELTQDDPKTGEPWMESLPKDPWGHEYGYKREGNKFKITSMGPDEMEGTDDDIVFPKAETTER